MPLNSQFYHSVRPHGWFYGLANMLMVRGLSASGLIGWVHKLYTCDSDDTRESGLIDSVHKLYTCDSDETRELGLIDSVHKLYTCDSDDTRESGLIDCVHKLYTCDSDDTRVRSDRLRAQTVHM